MDKILVVDDEAEIAELISMILGEEDLDVLTAGDGLEAFGIALEEHPRLVLRDVMMPRMDGVELCRRLQEASQIQDTVVLLMSAAGQIDLGECNAVGLIRKPFDLGDLSDTVHRQLGNAA
jgi:two-component system alkaline phosphatase synthesis response regulator PhoP